MRVLGIVLIVAGLVALLAGGINFTRRREVARIGPVSASVRESERFPVLRLAGGAMLLAGAALLVVGTRRRRA
jgi:hypothetical protein